MIKIMFYYCEVHLTYNWGIGFRLFNMPSLYSLAVNPERSEVRGLFECVFVFYTYMSVFLVILPELWPEIEIDIISTAQYKYFEWAGSKINIQIYRYDIIGFFLYIICLVTIVRCHRIFGCLLQHLLLTYKFKLICKVTHYFWDSVKCS